MKRLIYILTTLAYSVCLYAQEAKNEIHFTDEPVKTTTIENYQFSMTYRLQAGYSQDWQFMQQDSASYIYLHGVNMGVTFDFNLPYRFSIQTGVIYSMTTSHHEQHYPALKPSVRDPQVLDSWIYKHTVKVPVYAFYRQPLWKDLALVFYTGPEFNIGLNQMNRFTASMDNSTLNYLIDNNIHTKSYDRYGEDLLRFNLQYGLGGGIEWANYRVQSGYSFGLTPIGQSAAYTRNATYEWGWYVSFVYKLK